MAENFVERLQRKIDILQKRIDDERRPPEPLCYCTGGVCNKQPGARCKAAIQVKKNG